MARESDEHRVDALLAAVGHRPDDEQAAASAQARRRRRWLRQQAAESSTLAGVLTTLAELEAPVTIRCGPWAHRGVLRTVTTSLSIVEGHDGVALLPTGLIAVVEANAVVADDRVPAAGPDLAAVLATLAPEHPAVRLQLGDGTEVSGTLIELGKDVAGVRLTSSVATVRLSAVAGCVLPGPGNGGPAEGAQEDESGPDLESAADFGSG